MYDETLVYMVREMLMVMLKIAVPILASGVVVGLVVSVIQAVTSVQDQTLTFVPKIVVMIGVAVFLMPWIAMRLVEYTRAMFEALL
ncbi:MAG: flagellar biosynthetic protein FliQ [Planctomycetota bacterium]